MSLCLDTCAQEITVSLLLFVPSHTLNRVVQNIASGTHRCTLVAVPVPRFATTGLAPIPARRERYAKHVELTTDSSPRLRQTRRFVRARQPKSGPKVPRRPSWVHALPVAAVLTGTQHYFFPSHRLRLGGWMEEAWRVLLRRTWTKKKEKNSRSSDSDSLTILLVVACLFCFRFFFFIFFVLVKEDRNKRQTAGQRRTCMYPAIASRRCPCRNSVPEIIEPRPCQSYVFPFWFRD